MSNQELVMAPSRMPPAPQLIKEFNLEPTQWRVLVEQIFPTAKSVESVAMALSYCRARNLDIFKKPVHIVPMWNSAAGKMVETVWPGIAEIRTTAARTGEYAGIDAVEFGPTTERTFTGNAKVNGKWQDIDATIAYPEWANVVVYRMIKGKRYAFHTKVFWLEIYSKIGQSVVPNSMWAKRPFGQLDKCVEAAALRKAFPEEVGSMYSVDEMEGKSIDASLHEAPDEPAPTPPKPPAPPQTETQDPTSEEPDHSDLFHDLELALSGAPSLEDIEDTWNGFDIESLFDGDDLNRSIADKIKQRRVDEISDQFPGDLPAEALEAAGNLRAG